MNLTKSSRREILKYCCIFCLAALLCYFFPYTCDDWAWGGITGIERLQSGFRGYGGRYVGYLLSIVLTRSNLIKTFVMASILTAIVFLIKRITKFKYAISICCILLITIPTVMLREAVVWTSGFVNYCFPLATLLLYIDYTKNLFYDKQANIPPRSIWWHGVLTFLLAFINGLFVEHLTFFNVVFSLFVVFYSYKIYRKWIVQYLSYSAGAVFSAVLMFSNAAYTAAANGTDHYRQFAKNGIIRRIMYNFVYGFSPNLMFNNIFLNLFIFLLFITILRKFNKKEHPSVYKIFVLGASALLLFWIVSVLQIMIFGIDNKLTYIIYFDCLIAIFSLCITMTMLLLYFFYVRKSKLLLVFSGSIAVITAPLLVVTPISSRCFFSVYILWILIICCILKDLFDNGMLQIHKRLAKALIIIAISVCYSLHLYVYILNFTAVEVRISNCHQEVDNGKKTIVLEQLPYTAWLHCADPKDETYMYRFKDYYKLPQDVQILIEK